MNDILGFVSLVLVYVGWFVHLVLAIAVLIDDPPRRAVVGRIIWSLATLAGGVFVAATYWVLHHGLPILRPQVTVVPTPS